jgi:hypothetical protein
MMDEGRKESSMSRRTRPAAAFAAAVVALGTLTLCVACASTKGASTGGPVTRCGSSSTAVGVPVEIDVQRGHVSCQLAMSVEHGYAHAVATGQVHGNGGGSPVTVNGWICQGFETPVVDRTGNVSACRKDTQEILAVLPPVGSSSPSTP